MPSNQQEDKPKSKIRFWLLAGCTFVAALVGFMNNFFGLFAAYKPFEEALAEKPVIMKLENRVMLESLFHASWFIDDRFETEKGFGKWNMDDSTSVQTDLHDSAYTHVTHTFNYKSNEQQRKVVIFSSGTLGSLDRDKASFLSMAVFDIMGNNQGKLIHFKKVLSITKHESIHHVILREIGHNKFGLEIVSYLYPSYLIQAYARVIELDGYKEIFNDLINVSHNGNDMKDSDDPEYGILLFDFELLFKPMHKNDEYYTFIVDYHGKVPLQRKFYARDVLNKANELSEIESVPTETYNFYDRCYSFDYNRERYSENYECRERDNSKMSEKEGKKPAIPD